MDEKILSDSNDNDLVPSDLLINYQQRLRFLHRQNQQLQEHLNHLQCRMNNRTLETEGETQLTQGMQRIQTDDEMKHLKNLVVETQNAVFDVRRKNEELRNRVEELEETIRTERDRNSRLLDEDQQIINGLRTRLNELEGNFQQIMSSKSSFDTRSSFHSDYGEERTVFEQVYGTRQRHPQMIQLIVPWTTTTHRSIPISTKAITPPSSDYTDAYLAAFAPKPIRVRHLQRLITPVFVPVPQISRQLSSQTLSKRRPWSWGHFRYIPSYSFDLTLLPKTPSSRSYTRTLLSPPKTEQKLDRPETLPLRSESTNATSNKYQKMINEISEVLAIVSPLSSTLSSLSPGKSALDFDLSQENSPKLDHSTSTQTTNVTLRKNSHHLIREDSYDKIVHVMADLDSELPPTVIEEDHEMSNAEISPSTPNKIHQQTTCYENRVNKEYSSSSLSSDTSSLPSSDNYVPPLPLPTTIIDEQDPWLKENQPDDRRYPRCSSTSSDQSSSFSDSLEPHSSHHEPITSSDEPPSISTDSIRVRPVLPPAIPLIISPIESLPDSIVRRYISRDVYHGYLGRQTNGKVDKQLDSTRLLNASSDTINDDRILLSSAETVIEASSMLLSPQEVVSDSTSIPIEMSSSPSSSSSSSSACLKPPAENQEQSSNNTEADSLELIRALRGHSMIVTHSPSTSSSQIHHSDPYVSYAIHQLGDSSQERLPALPIVADLPVYKLPIPPRSSLTREDDQTDCDATENFTSFTDDVLLQRLYHHIQRDRKQYDTSSTDEDIDNEHYQRYDLPRTLSYDDSQRSSQQQQHSDDVYLIPGYPGLWQSSIDHDQTKTRIKSSNVPSSENALLENSEADSFHTCVSTQSQPITTTTSDERILLIRDSDRGISLPISMKIDCDHHPPHRLSVSIPTEVPLDLMKSTEQTRRTFQKSCKGPISISECDDYGQSITIENTSPSKHIDLENWILRQENENGDILTFVFPQSCLLRANHSLKLWSKNKSSQLGFYDLIATDIPSWHTTSHVIMTLTNAEGQERARLIKKIVPI